MRRESRRTPPGAVLDGRATPLELPGEASFAADVTTLHLSADPGGDLLAQGRAESQQPVASVDGNSPRGHVEAALWPPRAVTSLAVRRVVPPQRPSCIDVVPQLRVRVVCGGSSPLTRRQAAQAALEQAASRSSARRCGSCASSGTAGGRRGRARPRRSACHLNGTQAAHRSALVGRRAAPRRGAGAGWRGRVRHRGRGQPPAELTELNGSGVKEVTYEPSGRQLPQGRCCNLGLLE